MTSTTSSSPSNLSLRLGDKAVLILIDAKDEIASGASVWWDDKHKPDQQFLRFDTPSSPRYLLLLQDRKLHNKEVIPSLRLVSDDNSTNLDELPLDEEGIDKFVSYFQSLPQHPRVEIFRFLTTRILSVFDLYREEQFCRLLSALRNALPEMKLTREYSCWLTPHILYVEGVVGNDWPDVAPTLLVTTQKRVMSTRAKFFQTGEDSYSVIAVLEHPLDATNATEYDLTFLSQGRPMPLVPAADSQSLPGSSGFTGRINTRPVYQRHLIRESLGFYLLNHEDLKPDVAVSELFKRLQLFIETPVETSNNPNVPFSINFERVIPIDITGVFVCGWMLDPFNLLEKIEVVSALGFSFPVTNQFYRVRRDDVRQAFAESPYGNFEGDHGFLSYVLIPDEYKKLLSGDIPLIHFRFRIVLKNGDTMTVSPGQQYLDPFTARDYVLNTIHRDMVSDKMLLDCIGPAAQRLQNQCMQKVQVRDVISLGTMPDKPLASIIIPLYKRLEFMKVQFATMANDPAMHQCEIIYVLDSPDQEQEAKEFLLQHSYLYQVPAKLVIMQRNSGYAAANNAGAEFATGDFIVLMNSDVIPKTKGWVTAMTDFYNQTDNIGTLAPKLIYEDGSIQHAGIFFAKTIFPSWLNLHYYKGYPRYYERAMHNKPVPAVTGALLMIKRDLFEDMGRMSTEYVIGDFEDSDLCLQCANRGLDNWYFAEAELYHLERQSVPLNDSYTGGLSWRYNAAVHTRKWGKLIERLMEVYDTE